MSTLMGGTAGLGPQAALLEEAEPLKLRLLGLWGLFGLLFAVGSTGDLGGVGRGVWCGEGVKEWIMRFLRLWRILKGSSSSEETLRTGEGFRRSSSWMSFAAFRSLPFSLGSFEMSLTGPA